MRSLWQVLANLYNGRPVASPPLPHSHTTFCAKAYGAGGGLPKETDVLEVHCISWYPFAHHVTFEIVNKYHLYSDDQMFRV